jgi:hypothetical protein
MTRTARYHAGMSITLNDTEAACLKKLAERFESGEATWGVTAMEEMGLTVQNYKTVLSVLERYGYIKDPKHNLKTGSYGLFTIDASAVLAVRALAEEEKNKLTEEEKKKQEGKDIVEHVKVTLRKHPQLGWVVLVLMSATALITVANQLVSLLKNLNVIK